MHSFSKRFFSPFSLCIFVISPLISPTWGDYKHIFMTDLFICVQIYKIQFIHGVMCLLFTHLLGHLGPYVTINYIYAFLTLC